MKTNAMNSLKMLLLAALLLEPFAAGAKMTVTVTTPKRNAKLTNDTITATGLVKSTVPVAAVYYSFNGNDWALATGTTNWSVPDLSLTAGANSLWVYATDTNAVPTLTNKVAFTYVVLQPVTIEINGPGMVNPNYTGRLLQIGKSYVANAKADKGFAFTGWTGDVTNPATHLAFIMRSNLTLIATFVDVTPPKLTITSPVANQSISNSPIIPTCRATDNVGVTAVYYQLNGGEWSSNAISADGTNWTFAALDLTPGANTLRAYATDAVGKLSLTNAVTFNYTVPPFIGFAPASLSGLVGEVVGALGSGGVGEPFQISFGPATYAISSTDTNMGAAAGIYTCTVLDSNTVRFTSTLMTPTPWAGSKETRILVFTNEDTCVFTNEDSTLGTITFVPATKLLPSPSAILTMLHWVDGEVGTGTSVMGGGVITNYSDFGTPAQAATSWGTNFMFSFSPVALMMQQYPSNPGDAGSSDYTLLTFATPTNGTWTGVSFDSDQNPVWSGTGGFQIIGTTNPPAGNAPMNPAGKVITVSDSGATFKVCFADHTFTIFDGNPSHDNSGVNTYTYFKTGANTAKLVNIGVLPPHEESLTDISIVNLNFTSASTGTAQSEGSPSSFKMATASNYAPLSLAGQSFTIREGGSTAGTATFHNNGTLTFVENGGGTETVVYDYAQFSPLGGMIIMTHDNGWVTYFQVQFTSATAGSWYETDYDNLGVYQSVFAGTFTVN